MRRPRQGAAGQARGACAQNPRAASNVRPLPRVSAVVPPVLAPLRACERSCRPKGSFKGYGNRDFPQVRRTRLRLSRAQTGQSGRPKHPPPPGHPPPGASSASRGTARRTPARRRRRSATAKFRAGTWMVMGSCKNSPCKSSDGAGLAWTASLNRPRTRQESPCFPNCWGYAKTHDVVTVHHISAATAVPTKL